MKGSSTVLIWSWILFAVSVTCGFWSWLAQTGTLAEPGTEGLKINRSNIRIPSALQIIAFLGGLILTISYGVQVAP